ncbi:MAG: hypothetical protein PVF58_15130 [Candidatus Methanofastidiosia archaeon]|jgi:hypothetical protein
MLDTAIEYYEKSVELKEKLEDVYGSALTKYGIANILRNKKKFKKVFNPKKYLRTLKTN